MSFYADVRASFLGIGLPMAATVQLYLCQDYLDLYVHDRSNTRSQCTYSDLSLPRRGRQRCTKGTIALTTDGTMHLACVCVCVCMCVTNVHGEEVFDGVCVVVKADKAVVDEEHVNSKLIVLSAASVLAGTVVSMYTRCPYIRTSIAHTQTQYTKTQTCIDTLLVTCAWIQCLVQ